MHGGQVNHTIGILSCVSFSSSWYNYDPTHLRGKWYNSYGFPVIDKRRPTAATGYTRGGYCIRGRGEAEASNTITASCISRSRGRPPFIWLVLLHMAADQEKHIEPPYSIPASACNAAQTYGFCCQLCPARTV